MSKEETFRSELERDGFTPVNVEWEPNLVNDWHTHDFTARVMVLKGSVKIAREGSEIEYGPGDACEMGANVSHAEYVGPEGASLLVGRK